ncbi:hypothetical protein AB395_00005027 (plasmid) [Sinorhizobium fredii CCBAU 45436]|nr:hypothetical protein AB395_00005027 [Sinorhizobium fredii CCBAU 45436]
MIDLDHAIIVDVEPTTAIRQAEVTAAKRMIERSREEFGRCPARLAADSGYGSAEMLGWLVHIPVFDKSGRTDSTFSLKDFTWDRQNDSYRCLAGKVLTTRGTVVNGNQLLYRASKYDCNGCELKRRCCPKEPTRKVPRSIHEGGARSGSRYRQDGSLRDLETTEKEDRDAVCPSQTHSQAASVAINTNERRFRLSGIPTGLRI